MINVYFECEDCLILLNGNKVSKYISLNEDIYSIIFIPLNSKPCCITTLIIEDNDLIENDNYIVAKIDENSFYVFFDTNKYPLFSPQPISYYQEELLVDKTHYFTAYEQNNNFYITLESENEIYNINTLYKLEDIVIKHSKISIGYLIAIKARIKDGFYINVLLYDTDYHSLFLANANEIIINEDCICLIDYIKDSLNRKITRTFSFKDNRYMEANRSFSYLKTPSIINATIPYLFLEALFIKDYEYCKLFTSTEKLKNYIDLIGDFEKIIFTLDYKENVVNLLYNEKSRSLIKSFNFQISNNYIENIIEL